MVRGSKVSGIQKGCLGRKNRQNRLVGERACSETSSFKRSDSYLSEDLPGKGKSARCDGTDCFVV